MNEDFLKTSEKTEKTAAQNRSDVWKTGIWLAFVLIWCFGWAIYAVLGESFPRSATSL